MASIHGIVYIIIGAGVALASWQINFQQLLLFFYVGLAFTAWGILKLFFTSLKKKKEKPQQTKPHPHQPSHKHPDLQTLPKYCSHCGNMLHGHQNFCKYCGATVHHRK